MIKQFTAIKKDFFADSTKSFSKKFYIQADDVIFFSTFEQIKNDFQISVELYAHSNKFAKDVPIDISVYLEELQYFWQFKELFYQFENPTIIYHYKLLNSFSKEELQQIVQHFDFHKPILNVSFLKSNSSKRCSFGELFLPHYFNGGYYLVDGQGVEISVDLDESDFASVESD